MNTEINPYGFTRMEKWCTRVGQYQAYAGYTDSDVYLTWDIRKENEQEYPIFSGGCKIGLQDNLKREDFTEYRNVFDHFDTTRYIKEMQDCMYRVLNNPVEYRFQVQKEVAA